MNESGRLNIRDRFPNPGQSKDKKFIDFTNMKNGFERTTSQNYSGLTHMELISLLITEKAI